jgi:type II secretory pathway pseudopilin PulG
MSKMKGHSTNAGGFTLIETTIAMVVMMVVGLGATSLFLYAIRNNSGGEDRSQALAIAQQRLETLREAGYDDPELALGQTTSTVVLQNVTTGASAPADGGAVAFGGGGTTGTESPLVTASKAGHATPTPTPSGSPSPGASPSPGYGSDDTYKVVLDIEGLPAGAATPMQKRITIRVTPENRYGAASWINQNPVVIVLLRSNPANGPYRL